MFLGQQKRKARFAIRLSRRVAKRAFLCLVNAEPKLKGRSSRAATLVGGSKGGGRQIRNCSLEGGVVYMVATGQTASEACGGAGRQARVGDGWSIELLWIVGGPSA